ncbi:MAG: hypothetical protein HYV96_16305 [Opitutae bacterium]|nr:hypothetical protein [Opitutae bacterium]
MKLRVFVSRGPARVAALVLVSSVLALSAFATPKRLTIRGAQIYDEFQRPIVLRGANVNADDGALPPATAAAEVKNTYHMNCARLPVEFKYFPQGHPEHDNRTLDRNGDLVDLYTYSTDINQPVTRTSTPNGIPDIVELTQIWVNALTAQGIWTYLEARANDCDANAEQVKPNQNDGHFYDTTSLRHEKFLAFWKAIASAFKNTDYIAGYGILAEPSASRLGTSNTPPAEPVTTLTTFQIAVMNHISDAVNGAGDTWTPFFVGADFNYDTLQFRYSDYDAVIAAHPERCIFEVNVLMPKPWIQHGWSATTPAIPVDPLPDWDACYGATTTPGDPTGTQYSYPQTALPDYGVLLQRTQAEIDADDPHAWEEEIIFNRRRIETDKFPGLLNRAFFEWYLQHYATQFMAANKVPFVLDQFGASTDAIGQLTYEKELIETAEKFGLGWTRWGYNAGSSTRQIHGNPAVEIYYEDIGAAIDGGNVLAHAAVDSSGTGVARIRAEHASRQIAAVPDSFRWQLYDEASAIDLVALRAKPVGAGGTTPADATSPRLDFRVKFPATLSYPIDFYVWVRMKDGTSSNGIWYALDNGAAGELASANPNAWSWVNTKGTAPAAKVTVSEAGFHTLNIWMRKSNVAVDEVLLTTNASYNPNSAALPDYSARQIELPAVP